LSWITTVRRDGRPHVSPLVTVWFDGALWFSTGAAEQKAVNLHANRHVVVTTGCNSWDQGLDVVVEGDATRETDDGVLAQLAKAWSAKWDGRWQYEARRRLPPPRRRGGGYMRGPASKRPPVTWC